jgi:hypothetical protein
MSWSGVRQAGFVGNNLHVTRNLGISRGWKKKKGEAHPIPAAGRELGLPHSFIFLHRRLS